MFGGRAGLSLTFAMSWTLPLIDSESVKGVLGFRTVVHSASWLVDQATERVRLLIVSTVPSTHFLSQFSPFLIL